ncbi:MAG TPA: gamma-glutamyltransferase [Acidobacteriaceae bacterium]|nr:gamma-glutamyltransferase [Acidobacteriaceae bacterium]
MTKHSVPFLLLLSPMLALGQSAALPDVAPVQAQHAMVVSVHHDASDAGLKMLQAGGNAVDAAVATGFALAVVYPFAGNLGGGGFMMLRLANGESHFLDFRERAPLRASANMYVDSQGNIIPEASTVGYLAVGVPGTVAGLVEAERRFGKLSLRQVMAPAIQFASEGFVLSEQEAGQLHNPVLSRFPESRRIFQRDGNFYQTGDVFRQPDLARTLTRIEENPKSFYRGALASALARAIQKHGGLVSKKDLAAYRVKDRKPLTGTYRQYEILAPPPPSSGGVALLEMLNILEGFDLAALGDRTPASMHLIIEAFRRAFSDRTSFLGDPDFESMPTSQLIGKSYGAAWRKSIGNTATPSNSLSRPTGFIPGAESTQTTHYSILDEAGNAVSVTYTLNNGFGSGATADGLGFLLNDEMDDFTSKAGEPNMFGLIQGTANAIAPRKRPLSSMTPIIVLENHKVRFIIGSPGGPRIITTVANILLSATDGGLNIQRAVDAPRFHHQYLPDVVFVEPGFPPATLQSLRDMGYTIKEEGRYWSDGECIAVDPKTGMIEGGQDKRHNFGKAAGY